MIIQNQLVSRFKSDNIKHQAIVEAPVVFSQIII